MVMAISAPSCPCLFEWLSEDRLSFGISLKYAGQQQIRVLLVLYLNTLYLSLAIPGLPLAFILSLSLPSTPSNIYMTYPQRTLALLQVRTYALPASTELLHEILLKVCNIE